MGIVVEFCGLPGAGKSTIARALVASLRLQGVPTSDVMAPIGPNAERGARLRRKSTVLVRGLVRRDDLELATNLGLRSGQADVRDRVARPANLLIVRHAVRRSRRQPGVHVLDQGPVQEWWSAALRADDARVLEWAASDPAPRSDLLVRVDTPMDALVARLARRQARQSRLEAVDGEALRVELARGAALLDALCAGWEDSAGPDRPVLLRVDGQGPGAVDAVGAAVRRLT